MHRPGLTFGQLMRGDADEAKKEIRRLLAGSNTRKSVAAAAKATPRRLKVVAVRVFLTDVQALLDTGAVPNLLSTSPAYDLGLTLKPTTKKMTVANGKRFIFHGSFETVPISLAGIRVSVDFLVFNGMPFDVTIGAPALVSLHVQLELGQQTVKVTVGDLTAELNLDYGVSKNKFIGSSTDSEDFISDSGIMTETSDSDGDVFVVAVADHIPFEPGLNLETPDFDDDEIPHLIEDEVHSEDEMGLLEDARDDFQDHVDTIRAKIAHLSDSVS